VSIKIEVLRRYIRELIKQEIDEASVTGAIDGGEGPPKTPAAFRKKNSKKIKKAGHEEGHKDPAIFGFTKVSEAKFHVKTEIGSVIIDAGGKGEAVMKVAKALKKGRKGIISVNRVGVSKAKQVDKKLENVTEDINSKGYSQLNTMAKHATIYLRDLSKALRKQDDSAVLREVHFLAAQFTTMEKMLKDKKWNAKYNESVNEVDISKIRNQMNKETAKIRHSYEMMRKYSGDDVKKANHWKDVGNKAKDRMNALQDRINAARKKESVNEARTINVEPNWEGVWRYFKYMAQTNPAVWKRMQRNLGSEWGKLEKMAQQKRWQSESVNEEIAKGKGVQKIFDIQKNGYGKLGGRMVDQLSAGLFTQLYDKAPDNIKEKMNKMNEKRLYIVIGKMWDKFGKSVTLR